MKPANLEARAYARRDDESAEAWIAIATVNGEVKAKAVYLDRAEAVAFCTAMLVKGNYREVECLPLTIKLDMADKP